TKAMLIGFGVLSGLVAAGGAITLAVAGFNALKLALTLGSAGGLGTSLTAAASGLGVVANVLRGLSGVVVAGTVGWTLGKIIDSFGPDGSLGAWEGGKVYEFLHPYDPNAKLQNPRGWRGSVVAPRKGNGGMMHTEINIDGRKVAEAVTPIMSLSASGPQIGTSYFDPFRSMLPAGGAGGY
ncbi:MAG: hypothetical protein KGL39_41750, partial [Patescibacteria group bacterium]|nr:hypothetical protein [Patescibacteria group bacterium]